MSWILLVVAGLLEVGWATVLPLTGGLTPGWRVGGVDGSFDPPA